MRMKPLPQNPTWRVEGILFPILFLTVSVPRKLSSSSFAIPITDTPILCLRYEVHIISYMIISSALHPPDHVRAPRGQREFEEEKISCFYLSTTEF